MEGNSALSWRKSSYSGSNGGQCIEVAASDRVLVRDSKNPDGPILCFTLEAWQRLLASVKSGQHSYLPGANLRIVR